MRRDSEPSWSRRVRQGHHDRYLLTSLKLQGFMKPKGLFWKRIWWHPGMLACPLNFRAERPGRHQLRRAFASAEGQGILERF